MTGNCQIFDDLASCQPFTREVELVIHFRVIDFKVLRESHFGSAYQLHVSGTRDDELDGHGIVGLQLLRADRGTEGKVPYSTREVGGFACGKLLDMDSQLGSDKILVNIYIAASVEESVKWIGGSYMLCYGCFKRNGRNFQIA